MTQPTSPPFWSRDVPGLLAELGTRADGLDRDSAAARMATCGPNTLRPARKRPLLFELAARFRNPLILILLAASAITAFVGDVASFAIIGGIVFLSVTLDFVQEHRAGNAAERLRATVAVRATPLRDGVAREVPAEAIVPGDVVLLAPGDLVPADARLLEARDFFVNQAFLTGESYPVEKHAEAAASEATPPGQAANAVFMGTSVISGSARALVVRTGAATALGGIGRHLAVRPPATAFERGTAAFGMLIMRVTMLLVLFVVLVNLLLHRPLLDAFVFAVALAVGLTPELLPMVVSVTLARGALRMAERRVVVKRLSAVQDLGAVDVLCTDKTGTLTEGRIRLQRHCDIDGVERARVLELAYLNSHFETGLRSPLDAAILEHTTVPVSGWRKIDEVPFDFERRRVSVLLEGAQGRALVVKGAPEDLLRLCAQYEASDGALVPLTEDALARAEALHAALGREGYRALALAWRAVAPDHAHAVVTDETALVFSGFAAFLDPPKASAGPALASLAAHGIAINIVTGDNELVTRHVCGQLDFDIAGLLTGPEMQQLDDAALQARAASANVYCRVTPAQKARLIAALKARGRVVGFLGDGINDAPALHAADVGISVAGAVDVAREAAALILLEQDLGVLRDGVREGRRAFVNVMKYIMMGTSSNFGNMFSMAAATLLVPFLPMLPVQVLLNNLLYDVSELALPFDRVDEEAMARPCTWDMGFVRRSMVTLGPVSSLFDFVTFLVLLGGFGAGAALFRTGWFVESIATQVLVIFIIRTRRAPYASRPDARLVMLSLAIVACAALLPLLPSAAMLGFAPLPPAYYAAIACIVAAYLVAAELAKRSFYRRQTASVRQGAASS